MKKLIITLIITLLALPLYLQAAETQVTLAWDANDPAPFAYQVFCREAGQEYNFKDPAWEGDNTFTMCSINALDTTKEYYFVTRAVDENGVQSPSSNEVSYSEGNFSDEGRSVGGGGGDDSLSGSSCFIKSLLSR